MSAGTVTPTQRTVSSGAKVQDRRLTAVSRADRDLVRRGEQQCGA